MKLKINEVIEDVRAELLCYEEGEAVVDSWEKEFRQWIEKNKGKHKDIVADKNGVFLKIKDEEEIFEIADSYLNDILTEKRDSLELTYDSCMDSVDWAQFYPAYIAAVEALNAENDSAEPDAAGTETGSDTKAAS